MSLDRFLHFLISHNATVIEALFGLTLLAVIFLAIRSFLLSKDGVGAGASLDMGNLETMLQQILEKAGQLPAASGGASAAAGGSGGSEDGQRLLAEITNLKTDLEAKKKQIDEMKTATASAPAAAPGMSGEEKAALDEKIRELQAKLSEYEIISEDIADLSFYKEQNAKLQKELEGLKGGAPAAAAPTAPPPPAPAPAPAIEEVAPAKPVEEPAIVGKATAPAVEPEAPAAPAAPDVAIDDDLMAEFAAAVEKQKSSETPEIAAGPAVAATAAPAGTEDKAGVDLGQMDMDKMMSEAAGIKADGPEVGVEAALGSGVDENKLLQEAAALSSVSSEDKKLMGDFENFVKKGES
jgi:hypothetical protein